MDKLKIEGVPPHDGEYEIDWQRFNNRDYHTIRQTCGLRPDEIEDGLEHGDASLLVAFSIIALRNAGQVPVVEALWSAQPTSFSFIAGEVADAGPPPQPSSDDDERPSEPSTTSGTSGRSDGESPPASDPSSTGSQPSPTGTEASDLATSEI